MENMQPQHQQQLQWQQQQLQQQQQWQQQQQQPQHQPQQQLLQQQQQLGQQTVAIETTNVQPQQQARRSLAEKRRLTLTYLGIVEICVSAFCFLMGGVILVAKNEASLHTMYVTAGEALWATILPFISGIYAIVAGGKSSNKCKLQTNLGLAIVSAVSSFCLFAMSVYFNIGNAELSSIGYKAILGVIALLAFINFILFIVSASYTCALLPGCGCCGEDGTQEMAKVTTTNEQPSVTYLVPSSDEQIVHPQHLPNVPEGAVHQPQVPSYSNGQPMTSYAPTAPPMMSLPGGEQQYMMAGGNQQDMMSEKPPPYQQ